MTHSSQVPKQYYGYSLQCTECVAALLDAEPGASISLEVFDDVGIASPDGAITAIQAKAGTGINPVSDSSVELWKTFRNWIGQINAGAIKAERCHFELYVNSNKKGNLCSAMTNASSAEEVQEIVSRLNKKFLGRKNKKVKAGIGTELKSHLEIVLDESNANTLRHVIARFRHRAGSGRSYSDLAAKFEKFFIDKDVIDDVLLYALGWVKKLLDERIEKNVPAIIGVDEFRSQVTTFRNKLKSRPFLPSFAGAPAQEEIDTNRLTRYVRQMQFIEANEDEIYEAITDYLSAKANAVEYARRNLINETSLTELTDRLKAIWRHTKKRLELEEIAKDNVHFGQMIANACLGERTTLEGLEVPHKFTPGCFHALADVPEIGWHPAYKQMLKEAFK